MCCCYQGYDQIIAHLESTVQSRKKDLKNLVQIVTKAMALTNNLISFWIVSKKSWILE